MVQVTNMDESLFLNVRNMLAEIFQLPLEEIKSDLAFGDLPQWDSMGHMDIMIGLEDRFGVEINAETISKLTSLSEICSYLEERSNVG
jgi:acyl carrier protein